MRILILKNSWLNPTSSSAAVFKLSSFVAIRSISMSGCGSVAGFCQHLDKSTWIFSFLHPFFN